MDLYIWLTELGTLFLFFAYSFNLNCDGVEDEIRGEVRYGVNLPDERRIYIPKEEFDGSGK